MNNEKIFGMMNDRERWNGHVEFISVSDAEDNKSLQTSYFLPKAIISVIIYKLSVIKSTNS